MNRVTHTSGLRLLVAAACIAAGCTPEPPPRPVTDFLDNPRLLEATMVRCAENRAELKYTAECMNAREAVDRIAAREEAERRAALEAQSERKREALRRAQEAAAAARARAEEAERQRREAEYLGHFGEVTEEVIIVEDGTVVLPDGGQVPQSVTVPAGGDAVAPAPSNGGAESMPATTAQPSADEQTTQPETAAPPASGDLESIREELRRRQQAEDADQQ